jgi:stearoyl-CoA desaturase (Delta-9 desaturase)
MSTTSVIAEPAVGGDPKPIFGAARGEIDRAFIRLAVVVPLLALIAAVPLAWGWGITWIDIGLALGFYFLTGLGVTIGFHRHFTHRSFKANRPLRIGLAIAGSMAFQGDVITWVADHRRHHAYADKEGDPHSPWLFGTSPLAVAKGFYHSHVGWLFAKNPTNLDRFAPDLMADRDIARVSRQFPLWTLVSLFAPALLGGLITMSFWGALTGFFWAGLVRIAVLHHVTWSINSICHMVGTRPYTRRDRSTNVWVLAIASFGESWHNLHHADPTCARHGVGRGQLDISARLVWIFERFGWVRDVRWPSPRRLADLAARR